MVNTNTLAFIPDTVPSHLHPKYPSAKHLPPATNGTPTIKDQDHSSSLDVFPKIPPATHQITPTPEGYQSPQMLPQAIPPPKYPLPNNSHP